MPCRALPSTTPSRRWFNFFEVEDIDRAYKFLAERDATPIHQVEEVRDDQGGRFQHFSITTALGDVSFRFIQKTDWEGFAPGFEGLNGVSRGDTNDFSFSHIDHITCNAQTMAPMKLWLEHVLGMEQCWDIEFHTEDINKDATTGTGLRSVVMWDPRSGIKFPINEPLQPFFKEGQINKFVEDNWGAGVQHIALLVDDVCEAVKTLRSAISSSLTLRRLLRCGSIKARKPRRFRREYRPLDATIKRARDLD